MSERYPNLFIAGAIKCGTTALYEYLRQHPTVFFPDVKEPNFFNSEMSTATAFTLEEYLQLYAHVPTTAQYWGDATPLYIFSEVAAQQMHSASPEARVIIMLRRPADLIASLYHHNRLSGIEPLSMTEAIEAEPDRLEGRRVPHYVKHRHRLYYTQYPRFVGQIERMLSYFPREQVMFIIYDDLRRDTAQVYQQVLDFLGLPPFELPEFRRHNEARVPRSATLNAALRHPPNWLRVLTRAVTTARMRRKIYETGTALLARRARPEPMPPELDAQITEMFRGEVMQLEHIIDRDLSSWISPRDRSANEVAAPVA